MPRWPEKESGTAAPLIPQGFMFVLTGGVVHPPNIQSVMDEIVFNSSSSRLSLLPLFFAGLQFRDDGRLIAPCRVSIDGGVYCNIIIIFFNFYTRWDLVHLILWTESWRFWWKLQMHTTNHTKQFYSTKRLPRMWNLPRRNSTPGVLNQIEIKIIFISTKRLWTRSDVPWVIFISTCVETYDDSDGHPQSTLNHRAPSSIYRRGCMLHHHFSSSAMARPSLIKFYSERQAEVPMKIAHTKYSSWYFIMAHTLWGNSTNAAFVCHFEWQFVNVSILYRDHLIISSNMVVEEARILIRYLSPLSNATISSSRLFYVAPCARKLMT